MLDIVRGVLHMHDLGIVHQDIKSGNVMMARDYTAKIGDVGLAAVLAFSASRQSSPGTLEWTAPEVSPHWVYARRNLADTAQSGRQILSQVQSLCAAGCYELLPASLNHQMAFLQCLCSDR